MVTTTTAIGCLEFAGQGLTSTMTMGWASHRTFATETTRGDVPTQWLRKTGKTQGDIIEVLAPLTSQVEYIQEGARTVHNGQKVKIVTQ